MNDDPYKVAFPIMPKNVKPFEGTVLEFAEMVESAHRDLANAMAAAVENYVSEVAKSFAEQVPPPDFYRWN